MFVVELFLLPDLLTPNVCGFHTNKQFSDPPDGCAFPFHSILTLPGDCADPRNQGFSPTRWPSIPDASPNPGLLWFWLTGYKLVTTWGLIIFPSLLSVPLLSSFSSLPLFIPPSLLLFFPPSFPFFLLSFVSNNFLEWLTEIRNTLDYIYWFIVTAKWKRSTEQSMGRGGWNSHSLFGQDPRQYFVVFTNLEALWSLLFRDVCGPGITRAHCLNHCPLIER